MSKNFSITPEEFVQEFKELKDELMEDYFSSSSDISRVDELKSGGLSTNQIELVKKICDEQLTDALYTVLLGLDGCASISQHQISYNLKDENNNDLSGSGELEACAYEAFHENT